MGKYVRVFGLAMVLVFLLYRFRSKTDDAAMIEAAQKSLALWLGAIEAPGRLCITGGGEIQLR